MKPAINVIKLSFFLIFSIYGSASLMAAQIYKWVDAEGNTVFSETPPPDQTDSKVVKPQINSAPKAAKGQLDSEMKMLDSIIESKQQRAEEQQKAQEDLAFRQENCRRARTRQASYSVPRGKITMQDGTVVRPDEEARLKSLKQANDMVKEWCN